MRAALSVCLVACALTSASAVSPKAAFDAWAARHGRAYSDEEYPARLGVFTANLATITAHNAGGQHSWHMGLTPFADLTQAEFLANYVSPRAVKFSPTTSAHAGNASSHPTSPVSPVALPQTVDWRTKGAVGPVQNQGQCGSAVLYATLAAYEAAWAIHNGKLVDLSYQELIDCVPGFSCNGGFPDTKALFDFVNKNGLCSATGYPSINGQQGQCKSSSCSPIIPPGWVTSVMTVAPNDVTALQTAVANIGVVTVLVEADQLQFYAGGVFTGPCGASVDSALALVGYSAQGSTDYWILQNSWGASWGEGGYLLLDRAVSPSQPSGLCGILTQETVPIH